MVSGHELHGIGQARALHPAEAMLVAAATDWGSLCRQCGCGLIITAPTGLELRARYNEHSRLAAIEQMRGLA